MIFLIKKEFSLFANGQNGLASRVLFIFVAGLLFAIQVNSEQKEMNLLFANTIIMVLMIFSSNLNIANIFERDLKLGVLELVLAKTPSYRLILSKIFANWVLYSLPCAVFCPLIYMFFELGEVNFLQIFVGLTALSLIISIITVLFASLTAGLRNGNLLISILSLPLYLPVILGAAGYINSKGEFSYADFASFFGGSLLIFLPLAIVGGGIALKNAAE